MENRKFLTKKRKWLIFFLLYFFMHVWVSALLSLGHPDEQWVFLHGEETKGRVVDSETGVPIEDAIVIAEWPTYDMWQGWGPFGLFLYLSPFTWFVDSMGLYRYHYGKQFVAATDKDGRWVTPAWRLFQPWPYTHLGPSAPRFCIYKPGYKTIYNELGGWEMNGKGISCDINNLPFKKSLTTKEIEEDFDSFQTEGLFGLLGQERIKAVGLIKKALIDIPAENTKIIREYFR